MKSIRIDGIPLGVPQLRKLNDLSPWKIEARASLKYRTMGLFLEQKSKETACNRSCLVYLNRSSSILMPLLLQEGKACLSLSAWVSIPSSWTKVSFQRAELIFRRKEITGRRGVLRGGGYNQRVLDKEGRDGLLFQK